MLQPKASQKTAFEIGQVEDILLKSYVLKINKFDNVARDSLQEWIYFLKNSEIQDNFQARGLQEAAEKLKEDTLSQEEQRAYKQFQENRRIERSEKETVLQEGEEKGIEKRHSESSPQWPPAGPKRCRHQGTDGLKPGAARCAQKNSFYRSRPVPHRLRILTSAPNFGPIRSNPMAQLEPGDYYMSEEGFVVFTKQYHLKRGYCCQSGCKHCPYGFDPRTGRFKKR